ncbi:hypothetical protein ABFS83_12G080500 [Erythranthe nasuta]
MCTMMIYCPNLTKLKTKPIVYQKVISSRDSSTREYLTELSTKRKAIVDYVDENTSNSEQDIQKLEDYLPSLENLVHHLNVRAKNRTMLSWISDLKIRWSSVLTSSSMFNLGGPKLYQVNDINFELGMSLFLYGAILRDRAFQVLLSSDLVQSAALLRKAAGVYSYLSREILIYLTPDEDRTPEATPHISSVLSLVCLAEAQAVTARKAAENGKSDGLLAKLHCGVAEFLAEAADILLQVTTKECKDISSRLMDYILSCKTLHELKCYKYIVEGLDKNEDKVVGIAVGVLRRGLLNAKKNMPKEDSLRLLLKQEIIDDLTALLGRYERQNEFLWHGKLPCDTELPSPEAVRIVSIIPYQPQKSAKKLFFKM